jgi:antitoxin component YwqK of YwqJK toxin-antitoxin module
MVRNIFIALLFILLSTSGFAQKKIEKKFPNGIIEQVGFIDKDTLKDSTWLQYNKNGNLIAEAYYSHGIKVGVWKTYHDNGKLMFEIPYSDGKKKGEGRQYDNTGLLIASKNY